MASLRWIGIVIAAGFMTLSVVINWRYGTRLGRDSVDQVIFSAASLFADFAKATTPFLFFYAVAHKRWMPAAVAVIFWFACTCYSLASVGGFMEANRATVSGTLSSKRESETVLRTNISRKERDRTELGATMSPAVVDARLDQMKLDRRWALSKSCGEIHGGGERKFCQELSALDLARIQGLEGDRLDRELRDLRQQLAALGAAGTLTHGDPRVGFVMRHLQWQSETVEAVLSLLFLAVLEIGSGLGLFMAIGHGAPPMRATPGHVEGRRAVARLVEPSQDVTQLPSKRETVDGDTKEGSGVAPGVGDVAKFARARLIRATQKSVSVDQLHLDYCRWCQMQQLPPFEHDAFARQLAALARIVGFKTVIRAGKTAYLELALVED